MLTPGNFLFFLNPILIGVPRGGSPCDQMTNLKHWPPAPKAGGGIWVFRSPGESWQPTGHLVPSSQTASALAPPPPPPQGEASFLLPPSACTCRSPKTPVPSAAAGPLEFHCKPPAKFASYQFPFISSFTRQTFAESQPTVQPRAGMALREMCQHASAPCPSGWDILNGALHGESETAMQLTEK